MQTIASTTSLLGAMVGARSRESTAMPKTTTTVDHQEGRPRQVRRGPSAAPLPKTGGVLAATGNDRCRAKRHLA